jgi:ribosomal protein S18 acetylase RimI-like enzyme
MRLCWNKLGEVILASLTSGEVKTVDGVTTRAAGPNDKAFLTDVFLRSLRDAITATRGAWEEVRETAQFHEQLDLTRTSVIQYGGTDVGFMMCRDRDADIEIHTLCIAPEYQRRGIGTHVTQALVIAARDGGRGIVLSVLKTNTSARRLYERLGFDVVSESRHHHHMRFSQATCQRTL